MPEYEKMSKEELIQLLRDYDEFISEILYVDDAWNDKEKMLLDIFECCHQLDTEMSPRLVKHIFSLLENDTDD